MRQQLADPSVNVFTGEPFGEESDQDAFDMDSLFTIDEKKLKEAFAFDDSAFLGLSGSGTMDFSSVFGSAGDSIDLSGALNLGNISVNLPDIPSMSLSDFLKDLDVSVSYDGMAKVAESLLEGYQEYAASHPEADYSGLGEAFAAYLNTDEARTILINNIRDIIDSGGGVSVTVEDLRAMASALMSGYAQYVASNPDASFDSYLGTEGPQKILNEYAGKIFGDITGDITINEGQIQKLALELANGYLTYAAAGNGPDPSKMPEHFIAYLGTEDGQRRLSEGMMSIVDMDGLEQQISEAMGSYMQSTISAYGGAVSQALEQEITSAMGQIMEQIASGMESALGSMMSQIGSSLQNAMSIDADAFAEAFQMNMTGGELAELMMSMNATENATYENNLKNLGYVDFDVPTGIDIYPKDFESKEKVISLLDNYNARMEKEGKEEQVITYTDVVGALMSSVTDIIDIISYVLIAFVAISLIVSSIMIGVITYISVLERKKEIGILRAIGASKENISQVFNAETFIIGLCAGLIGIGISLLLLIPGNALIHYLAGTNDVSAVLPVIPAVVLILLSVILTLIGGLIPSRKAAKSDPVTALRTE